MRSLKSCMKQLLREEVESESGSISRQDAIAMAIIDKAMRGDLPAVNFIRELTEKKNVAPKMARETVRVRVIAENEA